VEQQSPPDFSPIALRDGWHRFPFHGLGRVVAFELGGFNLDLSPCYVVTNTGTLCPDLVLPGRELSGSQRTRLESIFDELSAENRPKTCIGARAATFIWYDDANRPLAHLTVESGCVGWRIAPSPATSAEGHFAATPEETVTLSTLCNELGFSRCGLTQNPPIQSDHPELKLARKVLPSALRMDLGVPAETSLANTTPVQRRRLCAWSAMTAQFAIQSAGFVLPRYTTTFEAAAGGDGVRFLGFGECLERFTTCSRAVGDVKSELERELLAFAESRLVLPKECNFGLVLVPKAP
jgi:hypothetical protein